MFIYIWLTQIKPVNTPNKRVDRQCFDIWLTLHVVPQNSSLPFVINILFYYQEAKIKFWQVKPICAYVDKSETLGAK